MTSTITPAEAQAQLTAWLEASTKLSKGQAVSINGRALTYADAREVRAMINYWSRMEASFQAAADAETAGDAGRGGHALAKFG